MCPKSLQPQFYELQGFLHYMKGIVPYKNWYLLSMKLFTIILEKERVEQSGFREVVIIFWLQLNKEDLRLVFAS